MPQAVERFGLMPKMDFEKKDLELIADWWWETYANTPYMGKNKGKGQGTGRRNGWK